jgi:hypothetical protein
MQNHAQGNRCNKELVLPHRQAEQRLVLRQRVHRVEHFNRDKDRETHRRRCVRHRVREHLASNLRECSAAFMEVGLRSRQFNVST